MKSRRKSSVGQALKRANQQKIAEHRRRIAASGTTQQQRSAARQQEQLAREAVARRRVQEHASKDRQAKREQAAALGVARKISISFYGRRLPDGAPRLWATKNNPVFVTPETATIISNYDTALQKAWHGDTSDLDEFVNTIITDLNGYDYALETDLQEIDRLIGKKHRIDFAKNYARRLHDPPHLCHYHG